MLPEALAKIKEALFDQARAWRLCLHPSRGVAAQAVMRDLARFCRAHESTAHPDPHVAARLDGRREVFLYVQERLRLDDETLWQLYTIRNKS